MDYFYAEDDELARLIKDFKGSHKVRTRNFWAFTTDSKLAKELGVPLTYYWQITMHWRTSFLR